MMLFLRRDTSREHPSGFEIPRSNFFDPNEDNSDDDTDGALHDGFISKFQANAKDESDVEKEELGKSTVGVPSSQSLSSKTQNECVKAIDDPQLCVDEEDSSNQECCAREGCKRKPRFDSVFCSDSCGVSALEKDLLHSFEYAHSIHPSLLRT